MSIVELNSLEDEKRFISSAKMCMIFFGSERCGHCIQIKPYYKTLSSRFPNVKFAHVEVSKVKVTGLESGVPVFVLYKNGTPIESVIGADEDGIETLLAL